MKKDQKDTQPMKWREAVELLMRIASIEDPEKLRQGDVLNLVDDLSLFLDVEGTGRLAEELVELKAKPTKLVPVIETVRSLVEAAADHTRAEVELGPTRIVLDGSRLGDKRGATLYDGALRDVIADFAANDFGKAEPWELCRCRWAECGKLFLAGRKGQAFCSHRCASADAVARYQRKKRKPQRKGAKK